MCNELVNHSNEDTKNINIKSFNENVLEIKPTEN